MIVFTSLVRQTRDAPAVGISELAGSGDVLVLAPHPDDESLAMGGAIAAASAIGRRIHVAVVTDGARSHPNSECHPPARPRALRRREVWQAVAILTEGSGVVHWLGYPDMAAPDDEAASRKSRPPWRRCFPTSRRSGPPGTATRTQITSASGVWRCG